MISEESAHRFTQEWIAAWNSHQIERILDHYAHSIEFTSPFVVKLIGNQDRYIMNKGDLREYFLRALKTYPQLKFQLINTYLSPDSLIIHYQSANQRLAAEYFQFDSDGKIIRVKAHYSIPPGNRDETPSYSAGQ
jgi:hypothetical protein